MKRERKRGEEKESRDIYEKRKRKRGREGKDEKREKKGRKKNVFVFVVLRVLVLLSAVHVVGALSRTGCKRWRCSELNFIGEVVDTKLRHEGGDEEGGLAGFRERLEKAARS